MPAAATRTTAVNAAFLQEIKDDHRELNDAIARLAGQFSQVSPPLTWRAIVELLQSLQDRLAMHFALEEGYGYCDDAIEVAPRLSERAAALRAEHAGLYLRLHVILDHAEQILFHETRRHHRRDIPGEFQEFVRDFERHEGRERDLITEAYGQDIGNCD